MIYGQLSGGLGNQLFIACYTLAIADHRGQSACLVTHGYTHPNSRALYFDTILAPLKDMEWSGTPTLSEISKLPTITDMNPLPPDSDQIFLSGYFQKWCYIKTYAPTLVEQLNLPTRFSGAVCAECKTTIAMHFRRGDYMKAPFNTVYHLLSNQYYKNALAHLTKNGTWTKVLICCEPKDWTQLIKPIIQELQLVAPTLTFGRPNCTTDWEEFTQMSQCGAVITANSSFSYWAAVLGQVPIVVRPTQWWTRDFKSKPHPGIVADDPSEICPPEWVPISDN